MAKKIKSKIKEKSNFDTVDAEARAYLSDPLWDVVTEKLEKGYTADAIRIQRMIVDTYREIARRKSAYL